MLVVVRWEPDAGLSFGTILYLYSEFVYLASGDTRVSVVLDLRFHPFSQYMAETVFPPTAREHIDNCTSVSRFQELWPTDQDGFLEVCRRRWFDGERCLLITYATPVGLVTGRYELLASFVRCNLQSLFPLPVGPYSVCMFLFAGSPLPPDSYTRAIIRLQEMARDGSSWVVLTDSHELYTNLRSVDPLVYLLDHSAPIEVHTSRLLLHSDRSVCILHRAPAHYASSAISLSPSTVVGTFI